MRYRCLMGRWLELLETLEMAKGREGAGAPRMW